MIGSSKKCFEKVVYKRERGKTHIYPYCVYYNPQTGCELNACIKNGAKRKGKHE